MLLQLESVHARLDTPQSTTSLVANKSRHIIPATSHNRSGQHQVYVSALQDIELSTMELDAKQLCNERAILIPRSELQAESVKFVLYTRNLWIMDQDAKAPHVVGMSFWM